MKLVLIFTLMINVVMNNKFLGQSLNSSFLKLSPWIKIAWRKHMDILSLSYVFLNYSLEWYISFVAYNLDNLIDEKWLLVLVVTC